MSFVMPWSLQNKIESITFSSEEVQIVKAFNGHYNAGVITITSTQKKLKKLQSDINFNCNEVVATLAEEKMSLDRLNLQIGITKTNVERCGEKVLQARQICEMRVDEYQEKEKILERQLSSCEEEIRSCQRSKTEAQNQYDAENENFQTLKRQNDELEETQKTTAAVGFSMSGVAAGLSVVGLIFPPLELVAAVVAVGSVAGVGATLTTVVIQENLKTSSDKLYSLHQNLTKTKDLLNNKSAQLQKTKNELQSIKDEKVKMTKMLENESKKPEIFRLIMGNLTDYQNIIIKWKSFTDEILDIYSKQLSLPLSIPNSKLADRNDKTFIAEIETVLKENKNLSNSFVDCEKHLCLKNW